MTRKTRILLVILASLALHSAIFASLWFWNFEIPFYEQPNLIEVTLEKGSFDDPSGPESEIRESNSRNGPQPLRFQDLFRAPNPRTGQPKKVGDSHPEILKDANSGGEGGAGSGEYSDIGGLAFQKGFSENHFLTALYRKIDLAVGYPEDLVRERIVGDVVVEVPVRKDGTIQNSEIRSRGSSPILEVYCLINILEALSAPLPDRQWASSESLKIRVLVSFKVYNFGNTPKEVRTGIMGNQFFLSRSRYVDPKVNQAIEKFFTRVIPPIIPIVGGVFVDFVRLYDWINHFGTPDPDEMRKLRVDYLRQQLELSKRQGLQNEQAQ